MQALLAIILNKPEGDVPPKALPSGVSQQHDGQAVSEEVKCGSTDMDKLERLAESRGDAEIIEVLKAHREWLEG